MASMQFINEFGSRRVFTLLGSGVDSSTDKHAVSAESTGLPLFGGDISYKKLASLLGQGAEVKHTKLSESFDYQNYREHHKGKTIVPLFIVDSRNRIQLVSNINDRPPQVGETIVSLIKELS